MKISLLACALTAVTTTAFANLAYQQQISLTQPRSSESVATSCVVLLHGLARSASSMNDLGDALVDNNFIVVAIDYPSRKFPIEVLAQNVVAAGVQACEAAGAKSVNFVTHSLGGILLRAYANTNAIERLSRVVMLGPPNNGSEVVDSMRDVPGFMWLNGPAGQQLGTGSAGVPATLGAANFEVAIIAGTSSINPILSSYLPDPNDGKVSVESTKIDNMCAHMQLDVSHPFLMSNEGVIDEAITYLLTGKFISGEADYPECSFR